MNADMRHLVTRAATLGFSFDGYDGQGHPRLRHYNGVVYSIPGSPSDSRSVRNTLAALERLSGRKLPRANAAHYRHQRQTQMDIQRSDVEQQQAQKVENLVAEADMLRDRFHQLADAEIKDHPVVSEARQVMSRYQHIRSVLAENHRIIPTIESVATQ